MMATNESSRSSLLAAAKKGNVQSWLSANKEPDVEALSVALDAAGAKQVFVSLTQELATAVEEIQGQFADLGSKALEPQHPFLRAAADFMFEYCKDDKKELPPSFMEAASQLHQLLLVIDPDRAGRAVANAIAKLCERLIAQERQGWPAVAPCAFNFLLMEATSEEGSEATLKRLYAMRKVLYIIELSDEDSRTQLDMLLKCFSMRLILGSTTGRKLLAAIMTADAFMPKACHEAIKAQFTVSIPSSSLQKQLGEVYWRAWEEGGRAGQAAEGATGQSTAAAAEEGQGKGKSKAPVVPALRCRVEEDALQDLLDCGLHATKPDLFNAVRRMLVTVIEERSRAGHGAKKGLDAGLVRVYEALLWRALDATNGIVRHNAARLLQDVLFMGQQPDSAAELGGPGARQKLLQQQVDALVSMAGDDFPSIREVAVQCISESLAHHWAVIPSTAAHNLLAKMVGLADDTRAPNVRAAAIHGVISLMRRQINSHAVLVGKGHLHSLSSLLHDKNEKVRSAAVELLETVAAFPGSIKGSWYSLGRDDDEEDEAEDEADGSAPRMVRQVLARLAMDEHVEGVAMGLVRLLGPFFFKKPAAGDQAGEGDKENDGSTTAASAGTKAGKGKAGAAKDKEKAKASQKAMATDASKYILAALQRYETATLAFLRYASRLPDDLAPKRVLAAVAATMWQNAYRGGTALAEEAAGVGVGGTSGAGAKAGDDLEGDDGFVRKKRGRADLKGKGGAGTACSGASSEAATQVLFLRTSAVSSHLRAATTLWAGLEQALPMRDALEDLPHGANGSGAGAGAGAGSNPETGGSMGTAFVSDATYVRRFLGRYIHAKSVSTLLRAFGGYTGMEAEAGSSGAGAGASRLAASLASVRTTITLALLEVSGRLPDLARVVQGASGKGQDGLEDDNMDWSDLCDTLWERLVALTPAQVGIAEGVGSSQVQCAGADGRRLLLGLVSCMVSMGRGGSLLDNALQSLTTTTAFLAKAVAHGGAPKAGAKPYASERAVLEAAGIVKDGGQAEGQLIHPLLAPSVLEAVLEHAKNIPAGTAASNGVASEDGQSVTTGIDASVFRGAGGRVTSVLQALVGGMTGVEGPLRAAPQVCATAAASLASRLAVLCARTWCTVDCKSVVTSFSAVAQGQAAGAAGAGQASHALSVAAVNTAEQHLNDAAGWAANSLLPLLVQHTWAAKLGLSAAGIGSDCAHADGYVTALTCGRAVVNMLLQMSADFSSPALGLGVTPALSLLVAVTSPRGVAVDPSSPIPGLDTAGASGGAEVTSTSPLDWLTGGAEAYQAGLTVTGVDGEEEDEVEQDTMGRIMALQEAGTVSHMAALNLALRLWSVACGNRTLVRSQQEVVQDGTGAAGVARPREYEEAVSMEPGHKGALVKAVANLVSAGYLMKAQSYADGDGEEQENEGEADGVSGASSGLAGMSLSPVDDSALVGTLPYKVAQGLLAEVAAMAKDKGGAGGTGAEKAEATACLALKALLHRMVLVSEGSTPAGTLQALCRPEEAPTKGKAKAKPAAELPALGLSSLGCVTTAALIQLSASKRWCCGAVASVLADRLAFVVGQPGCTDEHVAGALAPLLLCLSSMPATGDKVAAARAVGAQAVKAAQARQVSFTDSRLGKMLALALDTYPVPASASP